MRGHRLAFILSPAVLVGCGPRTPPPAAIPDLPPLSVQPAVPAPAARPPVPLPAADPLSAYPPGPPITLSARNVDVRALLLVLAETAGVSLVIDPTIEGRVTVNFVNVPAIEALRSVLAQSELGIAYGPPAVPLAPVVFYIVPVDIDQASAELIEERFGVSPEMARWIVANRSAPPR